MGERPNRYQRRVHKREANAAVWAALLTTVILFGCAFCALSSPLTTALYQQVLASNSQVSLAQVQEAWLLQYLQQYVNEYAFRYGHRNDVTPMFDTILRQAGARLE